MDFEYVYKFAATVFISNKAIYMYTNQQVGYRGE